MQTNQVPHYDLSDNTTGCCARFSPEGWDDQELHFKDKPFLRATTKSVMHVPVNMGSVFTRVQTKLEDADAIDEDNILVLSNDLSAWKAEHLFATDKPIEGEEMVTLSGEFVTKVFEGPYRDARNWYTEMQDVARTQGAVPGKVYFFYTTCPICAKAYGRNYVVGVAELKAA